MITAEGGNMFSNKKLIAIVQMITLIIALMLTYGQDTYGQLEDGTSQQRTTPVLVAFAQYPMTPAAATLVSPSDTIATPNPAYTWNAVPNATMYFLLVNDSTGSTMIQTLYTASDAGCESGTGTCSVMPTALANGAGTYSATLPEGSYTWWIQTLNDRGYGRLSDGMTFTVASSVCSDSPPISAILISPTGSVTTNTPAYTWNAVSNATYYYLYVNDSTGNVIKTWYSYLDAGCAAGTGTCSVTPSTTLAAGSGKWWILTWNCLGPGDWSSSLPFNIVTPSCNNAGLSVTVKDAQTGTVLPGASVSVNGATAVTTDSNGVATFANLTSNASNPATATVTVNKTGYIPVSQSVTLLCNQTTSVSITILSSANTTDKIRFIVTWGQQPRDLDSHLTGPKTNSASSTDRFHVYYGSKNNCNSTPCDATIPAWLDVDNTQGFGPETITIIKPAGSSNFLPGAYLYYVYQYSSGDPNYTIANSGAIVKVYNGATLIGQYTPPAPAASQTLGNGWFWSVVELDVAADGSVTLNPIGTYSNGVMNSPAPASWLDTIDANIFENMPSK